jgi:hypothetical protein
MKHVFPSLLCCLVTHIIEGRIFLCKKIAWEIFPHDLFRAYFTRFSIENADRKAPKTAPVKASGGIPISDIRITPIATAQASEYHGPRKTAHVTFTKCCIGKSLH